MMYQTFLRNFGPQIDSMQTKPTNNLFIYVMLVFAMLFWGTSFIFTSILLASLDPISIVFFRIVLSSIMLWIIIALFFRNEKITFSLFKWIAILALFQPFAYFMGETYGLQRVSPVVTSLIIATIPVFTTIVMRLFFKAKLTVLNFAGIFISLFGVVLMITGKNIQIDVDVFGLLLLFMAVFAAVGYGVILNKILFVVHPVWLIAIQNTVAILYFLPLYMGLRATPNFDHDAVFTFLSPQQEVWACIGILALFCSSLAFIFYSMGIGKIGVSRSAVFTNLVPIFAAITSFFILGERLTLLKIAGIVVVVVGLVLTQKKGLRNRFKNSKIQ
jgi:drug/metabolite transporter (DMT)-like permease